MPVFNRYPKLEALTGNEVLVLADASGQHTVTATASQIAGAPAFRRRQEAFTRIKGQKSVGLRIGF